MGLFEDACSPDRRTRIKAKSKVIGVLLLGEAVEIVLFLTDPARMVVTLALATIGVVGVSVIIWTTR